MLLIIKKSKTLISFSENYHLLKFLKSKTLISSLCIIFIIGICSLILFRKTHEQHQKNIILTDFYCYNEKWKNVIDIALSDVQYDDKINYCYNRAIDNYGVFPDLFFNYPQYYKLALYPDRESNPTIVPIVSDYYFDLGYINLSQQYAHAALALTPYNPRILERMVMISFIYGNYQAARDYLSLLSKNLVSSDFVKKYLPYTFDTCLVAKDKLIMEKRSFMPSNIIVSNNFIDRLKELLAKNNLNRRAYEHLQMCYLMAGSLDNFVVNLKASSNFYSNIPKIYEQAMVIHVLATKRDIVKRIKVSKRSQKTINSFFKILKSCNHNKDMAKPMLSSFANTYLYYYLYYSPASSVNNKNANKSN